MGKILKFNGFLTAKTLAVLLAGVLLFDAITAPLAEASVWDDRRAAQLAQLPTPANPLKPENLIRSLPNVKAHPAVLNSVARRWSPALNGAATDIVSSLQTIEPAYGSVR